MNELSEGWRLVTHDSFPSMTGNRHCTVCGGAADVLWRYLDEHREEVEVIPVCLNHSDRFERDADDPRLLTRTDTTAFASVSNQSHAAECGVAVWNPAPAMFQVRTFTSRLDSHP